MGEHLDRLTRLQQPDPLLALSLMERVRGYDKTVKGKKVHVSEHTRDGSGKAHAGEFKVFAKGKEVFTNKHNVDTADIHAGDTVSVDKEFLKSMDLRGDQNNPLLAEVFEVLSYRSDTPYLKGLNKKGDFVGLYHVPPEHITKVKPSARLKGEARTNQTERNRKSLSETKIKKLEAESGVGDAEQSKDEARLSEIDKLISKLHKERAEIMKRSGKHDEFYDEDI